MQVLLDALLTWFSCIGIWRLAQLIWGRLLWGGMLKGARKWMKRKRPTL
ncbi:MAG: hypothetical protein LIO42_02860 [Oscillospiraceae bacterium]|nr:hypothetical protein [Oscillospiraceae bacterium]